MWSKFGNCRRIHGLYSVRKTVSRLWRILMIGQQPETLILFPKMVLRFRAGRIFSLCFRFTTSTVFCSSISEGNGQVASWTTLKLISLVFLTQRLKAHASIHLDLKRMLRKDLRKCLIEWISGTTNHCAVKDIITDYPTVFQFVNFSLPSKWDEIHLLLAIEIIACNKFRNQVQTEAVKKGKHQSGQINIQSQQDAR